jgi:hypothetical protein
MAEPQQPPTSGAFDTTEKLQAYLDSCPPGLRYLSLQTRQIKSLAGVKFPPELTTLFLNKNQIETLEGVKFPSSLSLLMLDDNRITSLQGVKIPHGLQSFSIKNNPLQSVAGMITPNGIIKKYFIDNHPHLYVRDIEGEKSAFKAQKAEFKAARQSQKAELQKMSDLTQQSVQNQLKAVTSFLREGMASRAMEHDENIRTKRKGSDIFVRLADGTLYHVPLTTGMTVQNVLDYLNEHYYISVLNPNHGVVRLNLGSIQLDPSRTLASYNVENEATLHATPRYIGQGGGKRRIATHSKRSKNKRDRNKSKKRTQQ